MPPREEEYKSPREGQGRDAGKTIYVGQLRYETSERTVKEWFEKAYGPVAYVKVGARVGRGGGGDGTPPPMWRQSACTRWVQGRAELAGVGGGSAREKVGGRRRRRREQPRALSFDAPPLPPLPAAPL